MIECEPVVRVCIVNVAVPLLSVPAPSGLPPSKNVTLPDAALGVTVAVKVTELPKVEVLALEVSETELEVPVFTV